MLTTKELPRRGDYILNVTVWIDSVEAFAAELPKIKPVVAEWREKRQELCHSLLLGVQTEPQNQPAVESLLNRTYRSELSEVMRGVSVVITFAHDGQTYRQYFLEDATPSAPEKARPWWRFW